MITYIIIFICICFIWYILPYIKRIIEKVKEIKLQMQAEEKLLLEQKKHKEVCDQILLQLAEIPVVNELREPLNAVQNMLEISEEVVFSSFDESTIAIAKESNSVPLDWVLDYYKVGTIPLPVYIPYSMDTTLGIWADSNPNHFTFFREQVERRRYFTMTQFSVEPNTDIRVLEALLYKKICFFAFRGFTYNSAHKRFTFLLLPFTVIEDRNPPKKRKIKPIPVFDPVYN